MEKITIKGVSLFFDTKPTALCSKKLNENLYIEDKIVPVYFIGKSTLTFPQYYAADCPEFSEQDYFLSEEFQIITQRFPHTNTSKIQINDDGMYTIIDVSVYVHSEDYFTAMLQPDVYAEMCQELKKIVELAPIMESELQHLDGTKQKRLLLTGDYGSRELLSQANDSTLKQVQNKLVYVSEMYYFSRYNYAGVIEFLPEYKILTYDQFHEAYGRFIYSMTITKGKQTIPLLWPDYLYHKPENHLEFGILANSSGARYHSFQQWEENETICIDILAEGFEDVHFETTLKKPMLQRPKLSKEEYGEDEIICLSLNKVILEELQKKEIEFEWIDPKRTKANGYLLSYDLSGEELLFSSNQFNIQGRYQLKINSKVHGQLLFLFTIKKERFRQL